jgi:penicillin amidase
MKILYRITIGVAVLFFLFVIGIYFYLQSFKPKYSGELTLKGLNKKVEIYFDTYGIPHIYAKNENDAYFALGYVHAQERLFQMEMIRRVASGRLAEILGKDMADVDKFFRMLNINQNADESVKAYMNDNKLPFVKSANAYIDGINSFIDNGKSPIEFSLIGIPKSHFTPRDLYLISGYMSFSFALAFKTDPLCSKIEKLGPQYLKDLSSNRNNASFLIPTNSNTIDSSLYDQLISINEIFNKIPTVPWIGSNGWVIDSKHSKTGKVLFANDTHIGYAQPSVWYEAHLEYPGYSFYGNHLAGFPFAAIGHNKNVAWGLTMFEQDDIDFYREKVNPENSNQYYAKDHWENFIYRKEIIKIKDEKDLVFEVKETRNGPVTNNSMKDIARNETQPISIYWVQTKFPSTLLEVTYKLNHASNISEFENAISMIIAPGLNVMYGDKDGNIAWWTAAKLLKRPAHVNPNFILDGASGNDDALGYYDFKDNPHSINPTNGYVYSANNQPDTSAGILYPGYYVPDDRPKRLTSFLDSLKTYTIEDMKFLQGDVTNNNQAGYARLLCSIIDKSDKAGKDQLSIEAIKTLINWSGSHEVDDIAPTIYYKWLFYVLQYEMQDEIGLEDFDIFLSTHLMKTSIPLLLKNDSSAWWDNISTKNYKETRIEICTKAFNQTIKDLQNQLGNNVSLWQWGKVHTLAHVHPIGRQKPFDKFFNVGPMPAPGGMETIDNSGFHLNKDGLYPAQYGPAMRIVIDFSDIENSISINPTGQSGVLSSKHYSDQAEMYTNCKYRKQMMNNDEIKKTCSDILVLNPK